MMFGAAGAATGFRAGAAAGRRLDRPTAPTTSPGTHKPVDYSVLPDHPSVGQGKEFTRAQKKAMRELNRQKNEGKLLSDESGIELVEPQQHKKGVTPPRNEAHVDHINPKSPSDPTRTPGSNSSSNANILSGEENIKKSNN
jgi:hypothetical protein